MRSNLWYVEKKSDGSLEFALPSDQSIDADALVEAAQPFTLSLKSAYIVHQKHKFLTDVISHVKTVGNDLMIRSISALGDKPKVERVHFYENNVKAGKFLSGFEHNVIHVCADYDGKARLWLGLEVWEIDARANESGSLQSSLSGLTSAAGAVFPIIAGFAPLAGVLAGLPGLIGKLDHNDEIIRCNVEFLPRDRLVGNLLRKGTYVVFRNEVDGSQFRLESEHACRVITVDGKEMDEDYLVFVIEAGEFPVQEQTLSQEVAGVLTLLNQKGEDAAALGINFLQGALHAQSKFQALSRYNELKLKAEKDPKSMNDSEKKLLDSLTAREDLKEFIASTA